MRDAMKTWRPLFAVALLWAMPATAGLPQAHPWQVELRRYLSGLAAADFRLDATAWKLEEDYSKATDDKLYRDWLVIGNPSRLPGTAALFAAPELFTLAKIERDDGVYWFPDPAGVVWWTQLDIRGNPFRANAAAQRRALTSAIVDMLMIESSWIDPRNIKADFMGANLGTWAYTYQHAGKLLPAPTRKAYKQGMVFYLDHMARIAPRDSNTNMDMRELATLATLGEVFDEPAMRQRLVRLARRILFGDAHRGPATSDPRRGTFHPGGYIGEADGPETSYNGISLFHLLEAAAITRGDPAWDAFMPEVIDRMLRFKAANTFPEPNGRFDGPSSWAKRTNNPYPNDQRNRPWRDPAAAMLSDDGLWLLGVDPRQYKGGRAKHFGDRETMVAEIARGVDRLDRNHQKAIDSGRGLTPKIWREDHWPADIPYTWDAYRPGTYKRFAKAVKDRNLLLLAPFARPGDFSLNFDREFWVVKKGDWGFQVEAVPHMGRGYDGGGSGALAGGSLAAFWTRAAGLVVCGRLPDKWNYVTWRSVEMGVGKKKHKSWSVDQWPTHHLWGRNDQGHAFSSARQRDPWVSFELEGATPTVHVTGYLGTARTVEPDGALNDVGHILYRRKFEHVALGLRVTTQLLSRGEAALEHRGQEQDRRDRLTELWETLPLFIGPVPRREGVEPIAVTVEFRVGDAWRPATKELQTGVAAVRVTRFGAPVLIEFDRPQTVGLSDVITTVYQKRDLLRNLTIDLLGSKGEPVIMPARAEVSYLIRSGQAQP